MSDLDPRDDRAHWESRYVHRGPELERAPSPWVVERCLSLPPTALVADVAGGTGRHAAAIATRGPTVVLVDFIPRAVAAGAARHHRVLGVAADARALPFATGAFDAIVCVSFLDRDIFGTLTSLLAPGGVLIYETFTLAHLDVVASGRARGPSNRAFLLDSNELPTLVHPLSVQEHEERLVVDSAGERHVARVRAVKQ